VISVPLSFFCGMGGASKNGILIKGAVYIEELSKLKTVIFDKTGTLTKGKFEISEVKSANGFDNEQLLYLAAAAEKYSDHPIALAIKEKADISDSITEKAEQIVGKGVRALVDNKKVCVGNKAFMKDENVDFEDDFSDGTHVYVSADGVYAGVIIVKDMIKDGAKEALQTLRNYGAEAVMLTGDKKSVGEKTAKALGIEKAYCELLPSDKVEIAEKIIAENKGKNKVTAFAGDGINDAPVLSVSDVGIAMGVVGSDAAIEAANVVLMDDNLSKIPLAMKISSKTMRIVKQNVVFTLTVKIAVMILSVMGYANMWLAIFADVGAAVIAILNAVRAFGIKKTD
jgi:Cd2+/Zn2+-exporting ATPase